MERNSSLWRREASWRSTDTNAGSEAKTNMLDGDNGENFKVIKDVNDDKDGSNLEIHQHRSWTRLAASVKKGRGPRRIEVG